MKEHTPQPQSVSPKVKEEPITCPLCGSADTKDISSYSGNGILGPGAASWKTFDARMCNECGVHFTPVKRKGPPTFVRTIEVG